MSENAVNLPKSPFGQSSWDARWLAWLKQREHWLLAIGVLLQFVILLGMTVRHAAPLVFGNTLLLRVVPVDPRDLFRGDYVILSYDFSRRGGDVEGLSGQSYHNRRDWQGQTVYVSLVPEDDGVHWRTDKISINRPATGTYLQGTISGWNRIECGIESYFVQEGTGLDYERAIRNRKLSAEVAVTADGQATLSGLRIE